MNQLNNNYENNLILSLRLNNLKHMLIPTIMIIICLFLLAKIPFYNIIVPKDIEHLSELSTKPKDSYEYFSLSSDDWLYSGYDNNKNNEIKEYIFYKIVDNKCYFLLALPEDVNTSNMTLKNAFVQVTLKERTDSFNEFLKQFALDINWNFESLTEITSTAILNTASYNIGFYKFLLALLIFISIYMVLVLAYYVILCIFPILSPVFWKKHRHQTDSIKTATEFALLLQSELDNYKYNTDDIYITRHYFINLGSDDICIIPLNKLCFIFEHGNLHKFLWFYMKVTHTIYFLCSNGLKCHFTCKNSGNIDDIMKILKEIIPDLMVGYSTEHQLKYIDILKEKKQ